MHGSIAAAPPPTPWYRVLYVQVLIAIGLGIIVGYLFPAKQHPDLINTLKLVGEAFVNLIKMMIAPAIFCTVVHGIASMSDMKRVGRVGLKALVYFEAVSTVALLIGVIVAEVVKPGVGFNVDPATLDAKAVASYVSRAQADSVMAHLMALIPSTFFSAFSGGDLLQVLVIAILTGIAVANLGPVGASIAHAIDLAGKVFFRIIGIIVKVAPIGAFGAMAFTVGQYGLDALKPLLFLIGTFYATAILFVVVVLGSICWLNGFSIFRFVAYIKDELMIVLGTSSSETVLPQMMLKMERAGASKPVVGLVIPTGYSFNLDGTNIYMTLATLFLAQAVGADLSVGQYATIIVVAMLTSKGASGVTGAGFITLAATLAAIPNSPVPVAAMTLIFGIDKFMSECRALTNLVGNGVATLVVSNWEGELDREKLAVAMAHPAAVGDLVRAEPLQEAI